MHSTFEKMLAERQDVQRSAHMIATTRRNGLAMVNANGLPARLRSDHACFMECPTDQARIGTDAKVTLTGCR